MAQPLIIAMLAVPILIQVFSIRFGVLANRLAGENTHCLSICFDRRGNFLNWPWRQRSACLVSNPAQPLATVVGVLVEVPVMLLVVRWVNRSKDWYERKA